MSDENEGMGEVSDEHMKLRQAAEAEIIAEGHTTKRCSRFDCRRVLPLSEFGFIKKKNKLNCYCKECCRKLGRARWDKKNKEDQTTKATRKISPTKQMSRPINKGRSIRLEMKEEVEKAIKANPDWGSARHAATLGVNFEYVEYVRKSMELRGEIPILGMLMTKKGVFRKRKTVKSVDPYVRVKMVYFLQEISPESYIKIGYSFRGVYKRRDQFKTLPRKVRVLAAMPGNLRVERRLHDQCVDFRLPGTQEWYYPTQQLLDFIAKVNIEHPLVGCEGDSADGVLPGHIISAAELARKINEAREVEKSKFVKGVNPSKNPYAAEGKKQCLQCNKIKDMECFSVRMGYDDCLNADCKECCRPGTATYTTSKARVVIDQNIAVARQNLPPEDELPAQAAS